MIEITKMLENLNLDKTEESSKLRQDILNLVKKYTKSAHSNKTFVSGKSMIPVTGKVYGDMEMQMLVSSALDFWLTAGRYNDEFEKELSRILETNFVMTTNSGSSANLLALTSLTSEQLGEQALKPGDEVISVAAGFPTTVNPILQNNLVPVFVDVKIPTYVIDPDLIEDAITKKTKAIMLAHTLGNPFDIDKVIDVATKNNLWVIEDCCDALGSTYNGKMVGTFGDISTLSFYPAHHITMGEGGAVFTKDSRLKRIVESFRDWGRDCFCPTGMNNTCGKRFGWKLGELPQGYDHKFTYSHLGYNLKITDMQAAVGLAQLLSLPEFIKTRKRNFQFLKERLSHLEEFFILPEPTPKSDPSWFGFPITVRQTSKFSRDEIVFHLVVNNIDSRPLFAGNITKQPYFKNQKYKISGNLINTDTIMNQSFWIGVYPGITEEMLEYIVSKIENFVNNISNI